MTECENRDRQKDSYTERNSEEYKLIALYLVLN